MSDVPDPTQRFSVTVRDYARHRPSYPREVLEWAQAQLGRVPGVSVDLAAGTGILTGLARDRGWWVIGVEPNAEMIAAAAQARPGAWIRARAEATGLRAGSVDLVLCGQAFHWFEREPALAELERILAPSGVVVCVWNLRGTGPGVGADYEALLRHHSQSYRGRDAGIEFFDELRQALARRGVQEVWFEHDQELDLETLQGRARSASYVAHGVADLASFETALADLFEQHKSGEVLRFPYRTLALGWR
ncbi:MAG: class I SAM-dependent methyltransferase [Planctomycetota bacterium]|nr:class I SAM-dependent methyltransferase [Planctomycetota bacterium]